MPRHLVSALVLALAWALGPVSGAGAEENAPAEDPLLVTVDGAEIRRSDVEEALARVPPNLQGVPGGVLTGMVLDSLIDTKLAAAEARRRGIPEETEVKKIFARIEEQVLERLLLSRIVDARITEEELRRRYDALREEMKGEEEVRARHILLETEEEAKAAIAELEAGADFADLAEQKSVGPSAERGGDLGYFRADDMVAPFSEAAFALAPGTFSKTPLSTRFGWHVIKVEDRRPATPPAFAEAEPGLRVALSRDLSREVTPAFLAELKKAADIRRYDEDGSPLAPGNAEGTP